MENQFTTLAKESHRYIVKNGNEPNQGNITEEKESELSEYIDYAKMIIGVLGHVVFEPIVKSNVKEKANKNAVIFTYKGKLKAKGIITDEGFALLKGSELNPTTSKSAHSFTIKARKLYNNLIDENYRITEDILFSSPSAAAGFVGGCSLSGNVMWVTIDGKTPKDF